MTKLGSVFFELGHREGEHEIAIKFKQTPLEFPENNKIELNKIYRILTAGEKWMYFRHI